MSLSGMDWTQCQINAEVDCCGTGRIVEEYNRLRAEVKQLRKGIAVEAMEKEPEKLTAAVDSGLPVCPICKCAMKQRYYRGYYDSFSYWECGCESFPDADTWNGGYV